MGEWNFLHSSLEMNVIHNNKRPLTLFSQLHKGKDEMLRLNHPYTFTGLKQ